MAEPAISTDSNGRDATRMTAATRRVQAIDIARGVAMLLVCLSHFALTFLVRRGNLVTVEILTFITCIASPTFVFMSGAIVGIAFAMRRNDFPQFRLKLVDRALFLLTLGHLLLLGSRLPGRGFGHELFSIVFITDASAVSILTVSFLVPHVPAWARIRIAAVLMMFSLLVVHTMHGSAHFPQTLVEMLFGEHSTLSGSFAVVPWLAVYLASTAVGERLGAYFRRDDYRGVVRLLLRLGIASVLLAVCGRLMREVVGATLVVPSRALAELTSFTQKYPPGPTYVLLFGGAGMCLIAVVTECWRRGWLPRVTDAFETVGRASFCVFVLQAYLYFVVPHYKALPEALPWPLALAITLVPLYVGAKVWSAYNGNRYLTVGLPALLARLERLRAPEVELEVASKQGSSA